MQAIKKNLNVRPMVVGERFNMVIDSDQAQGLREPGGTFEDIPNKSFARNQLAITEELKSDISFNRSYAVANKFNSFEGPIGPQIDQMTGRLLPR